MADLTKKQKKDMFALALMAAIDYSQSDKMFNKSEPGKYVEKNPLLSKKPSKKELAGAGVIGLGAAYAAQKLLPDNKFREVLMDSINATQKQNIEENRHLMRYGKRKYSPGLMLKANFKF